MSTTIPVGQETEVEVWALAGSPTYMNDLGTQTAPSNITGIPPGMERGPESTTPPRGYKTITGTPTELGTYTVNLMRPNDLGGPDQVLATVDVSVVAAEPDPEDPEDPEDPDEPELPELDPFDLYAILARSLAPRVAAFVGKPGDADTIATAEAQVPVVTEYVRGYTRGRGFEDEAPAGPLRAVIVSGVARLATNPEQVAHFQTGDYSERPAQLAGWTLTELGVLRRYRRVTA